MPATLEAPILEQTTEPYVFTDEWSEVNCVEEAIVPSAYLRTRDFADRLFAAILLIPGLPLIAALAVLVRLTSKGKAFFCQHRVGKDGRVFQMYKIRTMVHNAETTSGPSWSQEEDSRITLIGKVLRKLHLDELPQLYNVIRGDMALIGPRPERPEFVTLLAFKLPNYLDRQSVLPGITGLAQINLPADSDLESVRRKLHVDRLYIQRANALLDLRIILCTLIRLIGIPGEVARRTMRLHHYVPPVNNTESLAADSPQDVEERISLTLVNLNQLFANETE